MELYNSVCTASIGYFMLKSVKIFFRRSELPWIRTAVSGHQQFLYQQPPSVKSVNAILEEFCELVQGEGNQHLPKKKSKKER